jgi:acetolactate synthase-1/3 small subunit
MSSSDSLHTIALFVANKPGVLLRITLVFSRRGFNIESLVVSSAFDGHYSRMTITAKGSDDTLDQIVKQLAKLVDVIDAHVHDGGNTVERELALIKLAITVNTRHDIMQLVSHFNAKTLHLSPEMILIEVSGDSSHVDMVVDTLSDYPVIELVRSGKMVMGKTAEKAATGNKRLHARK